MKFQKRLTDYVPFALGPSYLDDTEIHYSCRKGNPKIVIFFFVIFIPLTFLCFVAVIDLGFWTPIGSGRYSGMPVGLGLMANGLVVGVFVWLTYNNLQKYHLRAGLLSKQVDFFKGKKLIEEPSLGCVTLSKLQLKDGGNKSGREAFCVAVAGQSRAFILGVFTTQHAASEYLQIIEKETGLPVLEDNSIEFPETIGFVRLLANDQKAIEQRISL